MAGRSRHHCLLIGQLHHPRAMVAQPREVHVVRRRVQPVPAGEKQLGRQQQPACVRHTNYVVTRSGGSRDDSKSRQLEHMRM
jgi:hypothetical protein